MASQTFVGREVQVLQNDTNAAFFAGTQRSRIWDYLVPVGVTIRLANPLFMMLKLYGAGAVQIPANARLYLSRQKRGDFRVENLAEIPYAAYHNLDIDKQLNAEWKTRLEHLIGPMGVAGYEFQEGDRLVLSLESSMALNPADANNRIQFAIDLSN